MIFDLYQIRMYICAYYMKNFFLFLMIILHWKCVFSPGTSAKKRANFKKVVKHVSRKLYLLRTLRTLVSKLPASIDVENKLTLARLHNSMVDFLQRRDGPVIIRKDYQIKKIISAIAIGENICYMHISRLLTAVLIIAMRDMYIFKRHDECDVTQRRGVCYFSLF